MQANTGGEIRLSLSKFTTLTITLMILLLFVGLSSSNAKIEAVDQQVIHLPLIAKQTGWWEECIDCPHSFGNRSLNGAQLDSAGRIHVAYGGDQLYYAVQDDSGHFDIQIVDHQPGTGSGAALALDSSDHPHIVYQDGYESWKYIYQDEGSWHHEELPLSLNITSIVIVIDSEDRTHLALDSNTGLVHSYHNSENWQSITLEETVDHLSFALDQYDYPHLAYNENTLDLLKYATYDGAEWSISVIGDPGERGAGTSIVLDSASLPHVSYIGSDGYLKYAVKDGSEWQIETVAEGYSYASESSLKLDQSGTPYVVYTDLEYNCPRGICVSETLCKYRESEGNWISTPSWPTSMGATQRATLLIDASDDIHAVYDTWFKTLEAYSSGSPTTIDLAQDVYGGLELVIDRDGILHSTYHKHMDESFLGRVVYARREDNNWQIESGGQLSYLGGGTRLTLGPADEVIYVYPGKMYYGPYYELRYILRRRWSSSPMPYIGNAISIDIAVDSQGVVHFSYLNSNGLYYWYDPTSGLTSPEFVNFGPGSFLAMVIGANNQPCIAYHVYGTGLKYACRNGTEWTQDVVRAVNTYFISLDLDSDGQPHIVYIEGIAGSGEITHASFNGSDWNVEQVAWINGDLSMTIDGQDSIHLSYWNGANDIIHAYRKETGWVLDEVMTTGNAPMSTAIAVDSQGNPHIAYVDNELKDLRILRNSARSPQSINMICTSRSADY